MTRPEWISFLFVASQKTLPLSLAAILSMGLQTRHIAPAIAFCVVFHYAQILADSLLGSKLAQSK